VSYDLIMWCSEQSVRNPAELWTALFLGAKREREAAGTPATPDTKTTPLSLDDAKALIVPLQVARILKAFRREFADKVEVENGTEYGTSVRGVGWEFNLRDDAYYIHVTCSWELARKEAQITQLRRAALRAGCSTYDPQTDNLFQPV
jgi:hypothetical protein